MDLEDRTRVIRLLTEIQTSTEEASCSSDDMAAFINRVLKHLLGGIPPEWQFTSILNHIHDRPQPPSNISGSPLGWNAPTVSNDMWGSGSTFDVGNALLSLHTPTDTVGPLMQGDMLFPPVDDDFW